MRASSLLFVALGLLGACAAEAPDPAAHCPARDEITCATDLGGHVPYRVQGSTSGADDGYDGSRCGIGGGIAVEDAAFRWTAPRAGRYRFSTEGSAFDTILSARTGSCGGREITCDDDAVEGITHSVITLDLDACATITLVIDGHDADGVGAFALSISSSEASCEDALDDDEDGLVDCDDPDCAGPRCDVANHEWPDAWEALEAGVLEEVNRVRAAGAECEGVAQPPVPALERDTLLEVAAQLHSLDMTEHAYFSHDSLDGRMLPDRVAEAGFTGSSPIGENIASGQTTVAQVMAGWMASPGHCRNIMNAGYRVLGVGFADGADGTRWTQNFGGSH